MTEKAHGRTETRRTRVYELTDPADVGLFGALTLLKTDRERTVHRTGQTSFETAWHLCTLEPRRRTANQWAAHIRDHWGIESRNHNRRDSTLLEDKTRSRDRAIVGNLAVARAALLFFNSRIKDGNLSAFIDDCRESRTMTLRMLTSQKPFK